MTFCRRGNDYADVAQPFRLTGSSHGGGGNASADMLPSSPPHRPLSLCFVRPFLGWLKSWWSWRKLKMLTLKYLQSWSIIIIIKMTKLNSDNRFRWFQLQLNSRGKEWVWTETRRSAVVRLFGLAADLNQERLFCCLLPGSTVTTSIWVTSWNRSKLLPVSGWSPAPALIYSLIDSKASSSYFHFCSLPSLLLRFIVPFTQSFSAPSALALIWQEIFQALWCGCRSLCGRRIDRADLHT